MRASRLLSILMLLQTRGRMSAPALAAELEVSQRTVLRDIDQLSAAGVPVWAERGRDGGFRLQAGWSTDLTGLTEAEAQALLLAGLPAAATELGLGGASASARLKMLAAVPQALRADAQRAAARLHLDPVEWYRATPPPVHLQAVANAVWKQRVLAIRYDSWKGSRTRLIKPLGLVLKAGTWYVVALADTGKQPRTYRLSNIRELSVREGSFRYPAKFHLPGYWQATVRRFEAEIYQGNATVLLSQRGLQQIVEFSAAVRQSVLATAVPQHGHPQWTQASLPIESVEHAACQLLGLGAEVQVLAPAELRQHMAACLRSMQALYAA